MKKNQILKIVLGIIFGALTFSFATGILWYLLDYYLLKPTSCEGMFFLCINFNGKFGSLIVGVLGFLEGIFSGSIIGLVIVSYGKNKIKSFVLGTLINGLMPFVIIILMLDESAFPEISKEIIFSFLAHCLLGGILALAIYSIFQLKMFNQSDLQ